ncbi:MAG: ParB/RepB/Spo0J family partition protein [Xanthobacteraceae bacterium]|nr:ParB/RepB/Spo0J family partition protein [Xanthobacteraceae bacterium]
MAEDKRGPPRGFGDIEITEEDRANENYINTAKDVVTTSDANACEVDQYVELSVKNILKRKSADELDYDHVCALAESLKVARNGLINPLLVRPLREGEKMVKEGEPEKWVIVVGDHRHEAHMLAGMETVRCRIFKGSDLEMRIIQIEEDLLRRKGTVLTRAEDLSEWAQLRLKQGFETGQVVRKSTPGRPLGMLSRFLRQMPALGRSFDARRQVIQRATRIAAICPKAKQIAVDGGLDDNQDALLIIAKAGGRAAQVKKAKSLVKRLKLSMEERLKTDLAKEGKQHHKSDADEPEDESSTETKRTADADRDEDERERAADRTFEDVEELWKGAGGPKVWRHTPRAERKEFIAKLERARCEATADAINLVLDVFRGRTEVRARTLHAYARSKGFPKRAIRRVLQGLGARRRKPGNGPGPWVYLNPDKDVSGRASMILDSELNAPAEAERVSQDEDLDQILKESSSESNPYYDDI